jgi:hypothetical protein
MDYSMSCYNNVDLFKFKYDISRDNVPHKYCIGKGGFDKTLTIEEVIHEIAIPNGANVIVKGGKNAKWYVKNIPTELLDSSVRSKDKFYDVKKNYTSYVISTLSK